MDAVDGLLPDSINPNNFPAKLWRLVNNPTNKAIYWDSLGEIVVIDQQLFERQILSPCSITSDAADGFKTTNFSSFVRQLNLYGFRKADPAIKDSIRDRRSCHHHFYNPNFKRNHPELVASLRRLTVDNKAKIQAGLSVSCRLPSRYQRFSGGDDGRNVPKGATSLLSPRQEDSVHPYYPAKPQANTAHSGTPVPPRYLMRGHSTALSSSVLPADKLIPVSFNQHYPGVASSSSVHIQQGYLASASHGNPNFTSSNPHNAQYQPGFYSPFYHYYHPNLVASHMTGSGLFSSQSYYQAEYPVNVWSCGEQSQDLQNKENQEVKKCDVNLDIIFQIADEVMQTPPNNCLVKAVTPEKPAPMLQLSSNNAMLCVSPASIMKANPLHARAIMTNVSDSVDVVTCRQQEESVVAVSEQMPDDAISEVTSDEAKDTEFIGIKVSDTHMDPSQAYYSSRTRITPKL